MTTSAPTTTRPTGTSSTLPARAAGAVLAVLVTLVHVSDQGGLTALKDPAYVGQGYRLLELAGIVTAVLLLLGPARTRVAGWLLAAGVAVGPILGYVLSRGPGLPNYTDDKGVWTEPLGLIALTIEALLLVLALFSLRRARQAV